MTLDFYLKKGPFTRIFSQASAYIFQVYQEFQIQLTDLTVENLLEQFTLAKHTGLEKPGKIWYGTLLLKFSIFPVRILILWHRFQNSVHQ